MNNTGNGSVPFAYSRTVRDILTQHSAPHDVVVHAGDNHFSTLDDNWAAVERWLLARLRP